VRGGEKGATKMPPSHVEYLLFGNEIVRANPKEGI
jgi:hypothetical protein